MWDYVKKLEIKNWLYTGIIILLLYIILFIVNDIYIKQFERLYVYSNLLIQAMGAFLFTLISSLIILIYVEAKFKKIDKAQQDRIVENIDTRHQEHIKAIQEDIFKAIYGMSVEKPILEALESELFKKKTIRKNIHIDIALTIEKRGKLSFVKESLLMKYELENKSDEDFLYPFKISTTDREDKCIITEQQISMNGTVLKKLNPNKIPHTDISKHEHNYTIKPKQNLQIATKFALDFGICDTHYQNTIGLNEFAVGNTLITIHKPKGYLFTIELYSRKHNLILNPMYENIIEETNLRYEYNHAIFPGTGIEYTLEKAKKT